MRLIPIPDPLYSEAERIAAATGVSIEAFVQEALRLHLDEDGPIRLSTEQVSRVRQAEAEIDAGEGLSMKELREHFAAKTAAWMQDRNA
jgi:hypothetical protein